MTLAPDTVFAAYRIETLLGRGGMGEVYRATDGRLGRPVALKLVAPELAGAPGVRERFLAESRLAASLDHPHIVPIYEAGEADGRLFLAMRYVDGSDLGALLERDGRLAPERAVGLLRGIAEALDAAHDRGLVHRDVKPSNILVARTPRGDEHAYLADFGLVKQLGSGGGFTQSGQLLGSVDYVAPEQIEGRPIDARVDVYSLGCVLYAALTGEVPFPRDTDMATLWAHVQTAPPRPSALEPALGPFDDLLARALAKDPADRPASAGELLALATAALGGTTQVAQVRGTSSLPPRRRRRLTVVPIIATAAVAGAIVVGALAMTRPGLPSPTEGPNGTGSSPSASGQAPGASVAPVPVDRIVVASEHGPPDLPQCFRYGGVWESRLWSVEPGSTGMVRIPIDGDLYVHDPLWSPDGTRLAFEASDPTGANLYVWSAATDTVDRVTDFGPGVERARLMGWSPDGQRLLFARVEVSILDIATREIRPVRIDLPRSGSSGSVFGARPRSEGALTADTSPLPGTTEEPIPPDPPFINVVRWLRDGRLAVAVDDSIWTMPETGGGLTRLLRVRGMTLVDVVGSPDGNLVALQAYAGPADPANTELVHDIVVSRLDGSDARNITDSPANDIAPGWSADGSRVHFISRQAGGSALYAVAPAGGIATMILEAPPGEALCDATWGRAIATPQPPPTAEPGASVQPSTFHRGRLEPGIYETTIFSPAVSFRLGPGWYGYGHEADHVAVRDRGWYSGSELTQISILRLQSEVVDACSSASRLIGGAPIDVIDSLERHPELETTTVEPVNLAGHTGLTMEVRIVPGACGGEEGHEHLLHVFLVGNNTVAFPPKWTVRVWAIDVDGTTVTIIAGSPTEAFNESTATRIESIVHSLTFD